MKTAPSPEIEVPPSAAQIFERFVAAEYSYFSPSGSPLCWPVTPYWYPERGVLAVATGLAYPNKADYAAMNPKVAMLFSDFTSSGIEDATHVYVQGAATVLDEDLQGNTDRYVRELRDKFLSARLALNPITVKFLDFYLPRLWVEVTPVSIELRRPPTTVPPRAWRRDGTDIRFPGGSTKSEPPVSQEIPTSSLGDHERAALHRVIEDHAEGVLVFRGKDGFPIMERAPLASPGDGTVLINSHSPRASEGVSAALSMHRHSLGGTRFRAYMVRGRLIEDREGARLVAERLVGFFGNGFVFPLSVIPEVTRLRRRLKRELQKRDWKMPVLRVP